jgi:hypothetical protein
MKETGDAIGGSIHRAPVAVANSVALEQVAEGLQFKGQERSNP